MREIELSCGYKGKIDERLANDFEVLWLLKKTDEDINCFFTVLEKIFGSEEEIEKLVECLRGEDGFVTNEAIGDAVTEALNALGEDGKN